MASLYWLILLDHWLILVAVRMRKEGPAQSLWWTGRDSDPRPSGFSESDHANRTFFGPRRVYQAELPAPRADTKKNDF